MSSQQSLREIDRKILQEQQSGLLYRFFVDSEERVYLHLWQKIEFEKDHEEGFGIEKFQLSNENWAFEWKRGSSLKCARISDEHIPCKPKASPLMIMQSDNDVKAYSFFERYLQRNSKEMFPEIDFVRKTFKNL